MKNQVPAGGKSSRPVSPTQPSASPVRKHTPSNKAALESARPYLRLAAAALALPGKPRLSEDLETMLARAEQALAQSKRRELRKLRKDLRIIARCPAAIAALRSYIAREQCSPPASEPGTVHLIENLQTGERWKINEVGEVTILPPRRAKKKGGPR